MDDVVAVQVGQGEGNVMGYVDLDVVGEGGRGSLKEPCQALFHQLHQEDGSTAAGVVDHTKELDNTGMLHTSQDVALCIKMSSKVGSPGVVISEEDSVQDLGSTREVVQCGPNHAPIGACPENLRCEYSDILVYSQTDHQGVHGYLLTEPLGNGLLF